MLIALWSTTPSVIAADIPDALVKEVNLLQVQMAKSAETLFDGWISAAAAHRDSGSPAFRAVSKQLGEMKTRIASSLSQRKIVWVDKGGFIDGQNSQTDHYRYDAASNRVSFKFPFASWDESVIVFVWDSRFPVIAELSGELRRDYLVATSDNLITLTASTIYRELKLSYPVEAPNVVLHIFGRWYGVQAISLAEQSGG